MQILLNDIWTRRERKNKRLALWISEDVLVSDVNGTTENYLRMKARRAYRATVKKRFQNQDIMPDTGADYRYARKDDKYWYDYDRLPQRLQKALGPKEEVIKYHQQLPTLHRRTELATELAERLEAYAEFLPAYGEIDERRAKLLAQACAVVQFGADRMGNVAPSRDDSFYRDLAALVEAQDLAYLPKNYRVLKRKIQLVVDGADVRKVIRLPRAGNQNAAKEIDERIIGWLVMLRAHRANFSNAHIARKVKKMCALVGLTPPSKRWMESFLSQPEIKQLTAQGRYGSSKKGNKYTNYVPMQGALHPGDCWEMDGTRFNLLLHKAGDGKERGLYIVMVRDVNTGEIIGYHFTSYAEDTLAYMHALEMAVAAKGHLPYELVTDKFPGHNSEQWQRLSNRLTHHGTKMTITTSAQAKAAVERGILTLQDVFMQDSKYYYGHGITSTQDYAHRSPEYMTKMQQQARREGWDFDKSCAEATRIILAYNHTKYSEYSRVRAKVEQSPNGLYTEAVAKKETPWVRPLDDFQRVELFGKEVTKTLTRNGLIKLQVQHVNFYYQLTDVDVVLNYRKVRVCYEIADMSTVYLFENSDDANRRFLGVVEEQQTVRLQGPNPETKKLGKIKAKHEALKQAKEARFAELTAAVNAEDVDVLMAAATDKVQLADNENDWVLERIGANRDLRDQAPLPAPAPAPVLADAEDDDDVELDIKSFPRVWGA